MVVLEFLMGWHKNLGGERERVREERNGLGCQTVMNLGLHVVSSDRQREDLSNTTLKDCIWLPNNLIRTA